MNVFKLGHLSMVRSFKDGNLILLPSQNLFKIGRSFRIGILVEGTIH
jgi:hypothetical protein